MSFWQNSIPTDYKQSPTRTKLDTIRPIEAVQTGLDNTEGEDGTNDLSETNSIGQVTDNETIGVKGDESINDADFEDQEGDE